MYKLEVGKDITSQYSFKTAKILGFKTLKELGLTDGYFGGRVNKIVALKDSDNLLIVDNLFNVIGVMIPKDKKDQFPDVGKMVSEEKNDESDVFKCEKCSKEFDVNAKLTMHKRFCK